MRLGGRRLATAGIAAFAGLLVVAPAAEATFHEISIREVYPGSTAHPDSGYVELQMYAAGQNLVGGHALTVYDSTGALIGTFTFPGAVANAADQQTILIGDSGVQTQFGVAPDLTDAGLSIPAGGGAACWAGSIDCVAWGDFAGSTPSSLSVGAPADSGGIPDGMALRRTIAPGCSTLLEFGDDSNSSATDFFDASPNPRNNSSAITETACPPPPPPPSSFIDSKPPTPTNSTSATFTFHSDQAGVTFQCSRDGALFADCNDPSGITYSGLADGLHTFQVKASNGNGTGGAANYSWTVDTTPPTASITGHPADPSPGASAAFTYSSSQTGSTFQCSLAMGAGADSFASCPSTGKTYTNLADGSYTFKVVAKDPAGNQSSPASFAWTVDNTVADTTPPETTIDLKPADPSDSPDASFTYHSNEANSTFECRLDGGAFAPCPGTGIAYTGLGNGSHTFEVRATDPSDNTDLTPAGYTFDVAIPSPPPPPGASGRPPDTRLSGKPRAKTRDRTPTFRFHANVPGARFKCKVDRGPYRHCRSPFTTKRLAPGRHTIRVRAIFAGRQDPTPAGYRFRVVRH